ncbi:hypothetical protein HanXRQr2_Chr03g0101091 [Helianthus annuus]|uniref:Uncharacterized protein n=1 Tax=Helianthus annuus TaxID=4232 RepID=A0A9K3NVH9_HELAN|nr:hypothetical protein HanXRQr2_Chr03g0101091 [Helianthus annuus]KAJ0942874.1 hypothetical protein HanPSC8_Chr03g0097381 [Helianthus annuus]
MWFHMATVSMQPWRIYPLCLIIYKSEPHNQSFYSIDNSTDLEFIVAGRVNGRFHMAYLKKATRMVM